MIKLSDVCGICRGVDLNTRYRGGTFDIAKVVRLEDIQEDGNFDIDTLKSKTVPLNHRKYIVGKGDIIFRSEGDFLTAAYQPNDFTEVIVVASPLYLLRPNRSKILPEYLAWMINHLTTQRYFEYLIGKTGLRKIKLSDLAKLEIDLLDSTSNELIIETADLIDERNRLQNHLNNLKMMKAHFELMRVREGTDC